MVFWTLVNFYAIWPDQYTCQVSVYVLILSILIFKYWYWYFLFQKRTDILILQYFFSHQYQYFSNFLNDLVTSWKLCLIGSGYLQGQTLGLLWHKQNNKHHHVHSFLFLCIPYSSYSCLLFVWFWFQYTET